MPSTSNMGLESQILCTSGETQFQVSAAPTSRLSRTISSDLSLHPKNPFHNQSSASWGHHLGSPFGGAAEAFNEPLSVGSSVAGAQRPLERASHSKSRTGCLNCKRRRVKCDEKRPTCSGCNKRRFECQWPEVQVRKARAAVQRRSNTLPMQVSSLSGNFTMLDFRLFYRFIQKAYPHHPIGNDSVWTHEIPSISHDYDYLMHAMLALAASEITTEAHKNSDLACAAMSHRVKAIKAFNGALSKGIKSLEEGNAMLATCYTLLFQSWHVEDGMTEFMSFTRGCGIVAKTMRYTGLKFIFHNFPDDDNNPNERMRPYLDGPPGIDPKDVDAALNSLEAFSYLCQQSYEKHFHSLLVMTARACHTSAHDAYMGLRTMYETFIAKMSHRDFQDFTNISNPVGQLLQSHFVGVQLLMSPITDKELLGRIANSPAHETARWLGPIHRNIPTHLRKYNFWPISSAAVIHQESYLRETGAHSEQLEASLQKLDSAT